MDCLVEEMLCSVTAEQRSNAEQQRYSACIDHYAKLLKISLIVKAILDLVKSQTFCTAETPTGFSETLVTKTIESLLL